MTSPVRKIALDLLKIYHRDPQTFLKDELAKVEDMLSKKNRSFLQQILYGSIRWQITLDHLVKKFCQISKSSDERFILHLGFYQLLFMPQVPHYAVIHETVALKESIQAKKFLNGVLRRFQRSLVAPKEMNSIKNYSLWTGNTNNPLVFSKPLFTHKEEMQQISWRSSHPLWILKAYLQTLSQKQLYQTLHYNNLNPPNTIRVNRLKMEVSSLKEKLLQRQIEVKETPHPLGLDLAKLVFNPFRDPLFLQGCFSMQDTWSMEVVDRLDPQPEERILDVCAAPGGKTAYIAERLNNTGYILAVDSQKSRLKKIKENQERLGLTQIHLHQAEAEKLQLKDEFDRVLVDAPCSNSGAFSRRVEARFRQSPELVQELAQIQQKILKRVQRYVKVGAVLVYSTCSLFIEENQKQRECFLHEFSSTFKLEFEKLYIPGEPHFSGGYIAVFRRIAPDQNG
jgi:16S rRNA (cytosine967-C5)-methyltransferase